MWKLSAILLAAAATLSAQSPRYGVGRPPTPEEIREFGVGNCARWHRPAGRGGDGRGGTGALRGAVRAVSRTQGERGKGDSVLSLSSINLVPWNYYVRISHSLRRTARCAKSTKNPHPELSGTYHDHPAKPENLRRGARASSGLPRVAGQKTEEKGSAGFYPPIAAAVFSANGQEYIVQKLYIDGRARS